MVGASLYMRISSRFVLALLFGSSLFAAPNSPTFTAQIASDSIVVSGVEGNVVLKSIAIEPHQYVADIVQRDAVLTDDDHDGSVAFQLDAPIPPNSVWAAVDLATGSYALVSPGRVQALPLKHPPRIVPRNGEPHLMT